jgi:hypothetical protein
LVTGSHRSGTTWAGRTLNFAPGTAYLHEPFNIHTRSRLMTAIPPNWFHHVTPADEDAYYRAFRHLFGFRYPLMARLAEVRGHRELRRVVSEQRTSWAHRRSRTRPIMKDPLAFFPAEWLARSFGMRVLVMIRHPAAFCSSVMLKGWGFDFSNFQRQARLMGGYLAPFEKEISAELENPGDELSQAILLWNCIHHTMVRYREKNPDWAFVRHEDLSRDPVGGFRKIYADFDLRFSDDVRRGIEETTSQANPAEQIKGSEYKRDAKANIDNWKRRLSEDEIARIREGTRVMAAHFYSDEDW